MTNLSRAFRIAALFALATGSMGCSAIGLGVGAMIDNANEQEELRGAEVLARNPGSKVTAHVFGGRTVTGRLGSPLTPSGDEYRAAFADSRSRLPDPPLPRIGERLYPAKGGRPLVFAGTDRTGIVVRDGDRKVRTLRWAEADGMRSAGGEIDGAGIRALIEEGHLPPAEAIVVRDAGVSTPVSFATTRSFVVGGGGNAKLAGFVLGLAVDMFVLYQVAGASMRSNNGTIDWNPYGLH